jgi:hypothetical protein
VPTAGAICGVKPSLKALTCNHWGICDVMVIPWILAQHPEIDKVHNPSNSECHTPSSESCIQGKFYFFDDSAAMLSDRSSSTCTAFHRKDNTFHDHSCESAYPAFCMLIHCTQRTDVPVMCGSQHLVTGRCSEGDKPSTHPHAVLSKYPF